MRFELLYNPRLLCERVAAASRQRRRIAKLKNTPAKHLSIGHIDSLELLELANPLGIQTIYDIGANIGTWTLLAKSLIPDASVEAFEPLPKHIIGFQNNLREVLGVTLHRIGLGSENAIANLRVTDFSDASSILPLATAGRSEFGVNEVEVVSITVRRLDDYRLKAGLLPPDLIKLDVQGYELEVLKGAPECLHFVKAVITEVSFAKFYQDQCLFHSLVEFLATFGLFVAAFGNETRCGSIIMQTDVLFLKAEI